MRELDEIIDGSYEVAETFHPVHERGRAAWFPGNEAAALLVQMGHIWEDIAVLKEQYSLQDVGYKKQLTLKYVVIEVRSLILVFDRLAAVAMRAPIFDPAERQGWREITIEEKEKTTSLLKEYSKAKSQVGEMITAVRNEIGAHRGNINWQEVRRFWSAISPNLVNPILHAIPPAYEYIRELDLFEWNRVHEDGVHELIGAQIRPEYLKWVSDDKS